MIAAISLHSGMMKTNDLRGVNMNFFKLKRNDKEVFLNSDEVLATIDVVRDHAVITGLIPADGENWEVYLVPSSEYCEHLLRKVYKAFSDELERIKQSWTHKTPDEICSMCYMAVYISDIMNALDNADASDFDFETLEKWLQDPKEMIRLVCDFITNRNSSDYNEAICNFISQGTEG